MKALQSVPRDGLAEGQGRPPRASEEGAGQGDTTFRWNRGVARVSSEQAPCHPPICPSQSGFPGTPASEQPGPCTGYRVRAFGRKLALSVSAYLLPEQSEFEHRSKGGPRIRSCRNVLEMQVLRPWRRFLDQGLGGGPDSAGMLTHGPVAGALAEGKGPQQRPTLEHSWELNVHRLPTTQAPAPRDPGLVGLGRCPHNRKHSPG